MTNENTLGHSVVTQVVTRIIVVTLKNRLKLAFGGSGHRRIRTPNPLIRSQVLYPVELCGQVCPISFVKNYINCFKGRKPIAELGIWTYQIQLLSFA
jgi:hypothetical protein